MFVADLCKESIAAMAMQMEVGEFPVGTLICLDYTAPPGGMVELNFSSGTEGGDIHLHLNARYDEPSLVLNSNIDGHWGPEERPSGFPLHAGERENLYIHVTF